MRLWEKEDMMLSTDVGLSRVNYGIANLLEFIDRVIEDGGIEDDNGIMRKAQFS